MNRKNFGLLVESLRVERFDSDGKHWTRDHLAEISGLSYKIIENIEYGKKSKITEDELSMLAKAFQLSTMEKREFFIGALDLEENTINADYPNAIEIFENKIMPIIQDIGFPTMLINRFYDIIAVNSLISTIYGIDPHGALMSVTTEKIIPNIMTILVENPVIKETINDEQLKNYIRVNLKHFKTATLRYRYEPQYKKLFNKLMGNKLFREVWEESLFYSELHNQNAETMSFHHPKLGPLSFITKETTFITNLNELFLIVYIPLTKNTQEVFASIEKQINNRIYVVPEWKDWTGLHY